MHVRVGAHHITVNLLHDLIVLQGEVGMKGRRAEAASTDADTLDMTSCPAAAAAAAALADHFPHMHGTSKNESTQFRGAAAATAACSGYNAPTSVTATS